MSETTLPTATDGQEQVRQHQEMIQRILDENNRIVQVSLASLKETMCMYAQPAAPVAPAAPPPIET